LLFHSKNCYTNAPQYYVTPILPVLLLVTNNTNKATTNNNDRHPLFAVCFNNLHSSYKYSHRTHSVHPQFPFSTLCPICCTVQFTQSHLLSVPNTVLCAVPLLQHSLYDDHMWCLHRWIISPKLYFPYKQVLPAVCPFRHCLTGRYL